MASRLFTLIKNQCFLLSFDENTLFKSKNSELFILDYLCLAKCILDTHLMLIK